MIAPLLPFFGVQTASIAAPRQWVSPSLRRGDEIIYMSGPGGVYMYRRHPAFELAGYLSVDQNASTAGPALDAQQNLYVVDFKDGPGASVIDEYRHSGRRFKLVKQFTQADFGSAITVGQDGSVYAVGNGGEVLEYAASGGPPVNALYSNKEFNVASGVAVDAQDDVFVSYQFQPSGLRGLDQRESEDGIPDGSSGGCHRRSGEIDEFPAGSSKGRCVNSTLPTRYPGPLAFDAGGNLVAGNFGVGRIGEVTVLSPPDWDVTSVTKIPQAAAALAFGMPNHLYYLNGNDRVVERAYPSGAVVGSWWLHQPWANGLAVGRW